MFCRFIGFDYFSIHSTKLDQSIDYELLLSLIIIILLSFLFLLVSRSIISNLYLNHLVLSLLFKIILYRNYKLS